MKLRRGFVTNSSSTSFVCDMYQLENDLRETFRDLLDEAMFHVKSRTNEVMVVETDHFMITVVKKDSY